MVDARDGLTAGEMVLIVVVLRVEKMAAWMVYVWVVSREI